MNAQVFPAHFDLAQRYGLPMYLHSRNTAGDFARTAPASSPSAIGIVKENRSKFSSGVVHSFTGDEEELHALLAMDLYIGVNGCSLKTKENLEIAKQVPLDRIMLETGTLFPD